MYDGGTTLEDAAHARPRQGDDLDAGILHREDAATTSRTGATRRSRCNHPLGVAGDRRVPDGRCRGSPASRSRCARTGAWPAGRRDRRLQCAYPRQEVRDLRRSGPRATASPRFLLELGAEPTPLLATNGSKAWEEKMQALFGTSPFGKNCHVYAGKDLWHMRSLLFTEPVDFLIGNTYGKYPRARHGDAADPHRLPDLRSPPPSPLPGVGLSGRHERAGRRCSTRSSTRSIDEHRSSRRRRTTASTSFADRPTRAVFAPPAA